MISAKTKARWDYYNVIDGAKIQGREEGEARGEARGIHKKAVEAAQTLLARNIDLNIISEATGLSQEEIKAL
ncbi:hypothetical protein D3C87_1559670 [compost metagenome]